MKTVRELTEEIETLTIAYGKRIGSPEETYYKDVLTTARVILELEIRKTLK